MRDLLFDDIFAMSRILNKMQLKVDFKEIDTKGKTAEQVGVEMIGKIVLKALENIHLARDEVNNFLGDLNGMTGEQFRSLPLKDTLKYMTELKDNIPQDFFDLAGKMK